MNSTIYLFGKLGQDITVSVNDYTKSFFEEFISKANAPTQIIIHRNGDIMNYGYVRKIENNNLFGICVQINGQYISTTKKLFEVFENIIANIAIRGEILHLNRRGDLEATTLNLLDKPEEIERAIANCQNEFSKLAPTCKPLPDIDFSTSDSDMFFFKENEDNNTIIKTSVKNGYAFIYKEDDYDTLFLSGYRSTLSALNKENETYKKRISDQDYKLKILEREKKQMGAVVALFITLFIGSILFFNTVEKKNKDIKVKEKTIDILRVENDTLIDNNIELIEDNIELIEEKTKLQSHNNDLKIKQEATSKELNNLIFEYEKLNRNYVTLEQKNNNYLKEINILTSKNIALETKLKKAESDLASKNAAYKTLQSRYDRISNDLTIMENKYYSTKEGKKELRQ